MAIRPILRMGHPVLRAKAAPIGDPADEGTSELIRDMTETLKDADGVGLAAPQIGISQRLILVEIPAQRLAAEDHAEADQAVHQVLINPEIEPLDDPERSALGWEACLSIPGLIGQVPRWRRIRFRALGPDGTAIEGTAEGFHARVIQHEVDHLDGILYPERMADLSRLMFVDELQEHGPPATPGEMA
ncbi:MAG: peptide deformylase [Alphaproteobacteria bacterium]|nr:peptide deformylase [Alphaproteobacteria bacterium]